MLGSRIQWGSLCETSYQGEEIQTGCLQLREEWGDTKERPVLDNKKLLKCHFIVMMIENLKALGVPMDLLKDQPRKVIAPSQISMLDPF